MKFLNYNWLLCLLLLAACDTSKEIATPDFNVTTEAATYKAGEEVKFIFSGDAGLITFYSGEMGNDYAYKDQRRIDQIEEIRLSFQTHDQEANPLPAVSLAIFKVMLSTDFNGTYDYENVSAATWTDISDRFTIAQPRAWGNDAGWFDSGVANLNDLPEPGKPFYIGFQYIVPPYSGSTAQTRRWRMRNFNLASTTTSGTQQTLGTYTPANWSLISRDDPRTTASQLASSIMLFAPRSATSPESVEEWAVSLPFSADEIDLGYEFGVAVKGYGEAAMPEYKHVYQSAGTYRVTFIASNANIHDSKEVVRQLDVTIVP